jgi:hypothetical protein
MTQEQPKGTITLNIINKGLIDAKFMNVVVKDTENYEVVSSNEEYIGNVDSDDFETTDITIMRKNMQNPFDLQFDVTYLDANNNEYMSSEIISVKLYPGENGGFGFGSILLIIIVLIVGYVAYKKFFKKRRNNK